MDKRTIAFIKKKFPKLFLAVVRFAPAAYLVTELDRLRYIYCMMFKKPYFGTVALSGQTWFERKPYMRQLVRNEIGGKKNKTVNILEIGSWTGDSAVLWADAIKSSGAQGHVYCVDPWEPYLKSGKEENVNTATLIMDRALRRGKILKLFLHNIAASRNVDIVHPIKGYSSRILPVLNGGSFDIIYVDGDHSYQGVKQDLNQVERLLKEGGVICGDDLDMQLEDVDKDFAEKCKEKNYVEDPKTSKAYHPGVTAAVAEFFKGQVSCYNGFWAMRKKAPGWEKVLLSPYEQ